MGNNTNQGEPLVHPDLYIKTLYLLLNDSSV